MNQQVVLLLLPYERDCRQLIQLLAWNIQQNLPLNTDNFPCVDIALVEINITTSALNVNMPCLCLFIYLKLQKQAKKKNQGFYSNPVNNNPQGRLSRACTVVEVVVRDLGSFFFFKLLKCSSFGGKKWQPTPLFLPGKCHGQRSLAGFSPWRHKDLDTAE